MPGSGVGQHQHVCEAECKGLLVSLAFKLVLLAAGAWAIFLRPSVAIMPRIFLFRSIIILLVFVCSFVHWLFYIVQVSDTDVGIFIEINFLTGN